MESIQQNNTEKVLEIINRAPDIDFNYAKKVDGKSLLYVAIENNEIEVVKLLIIDNNATVNQANKYGNTPLYIASMLGYDEIVKLLIENDATINRVIYGLTPLYAASWHGLVEVGEPWREQSASVALADSH